MRFEMLAKNPDTNQEMRLLYDNETNTLTREDGLIYEYPEDQRTPASDVEPFHGVMRKSRSITTLKIQLGLSCNYECEYCSQRFVGRPPPTNQNDIDEFMEKLDGLEFDEQTGLKIEFWGGEPLVYFKTLRPLVAALKKKFEHWDRRPVMSMITNGSLLTTEINTWLINNCFMVAISHDGPGQHVRGPDPFDDVPTKWAILDLYHALRPLCRISFNAMLNSVGASRKEIYDWFVAMTGDPDVILGEGGLIDAYDEGGYGTSLLTKAQQFKFRQTAFNDIYSSNGRVGFYGILEKIDGFTRRLLTHSPATSVGQKCGMDDPHRIAVDLKGNVITCQNVSVVEIAMNGESHLGGNIAKIEEVELKSATHWRDRDHCAGCPVLHICGGSCMFLSGKYWDVSCANAYSDAIVLFSLSIAAITGGFVPVYITAPGLPDHRKDIWGTILKHEDTPPRRIIPIKAN